MTKTIIEISGPDFVGKSTQAELLTYETQGIHVHNFGSFTGYSKKIPDNLSPKEFFEWWFVTSTFSELCESLIDAYNNRLTKVLLATNLDVAVVERGAGMLRAQLIATFLTRERKRPKDTLALNKIAKAVDKKIAKLIALPPNMLKQELYLKPCSQWQKTIAKYRSVLRTQKGDGARFSKEQNALYSIYQKNLNDILKSHMSKSNTVIANCPAVDVQNALRKKVIQPTLPPLLANNPIYVGLAGLSETGKSAIAEYLQQNHNFSRLKIGFFNENLRDVDLAYAKPTKVALSITHFLSTNRHINRATLESFHGADIHIALKLILGERWTAILLTLPDKERVDRLEKQFPNKSPIALRQQQKQKDKTKLKQGLAEYQKFADVTIDNSDIIEHTAKKILNHIKKAHD